MDSSCHLPSSNHSTRPSSWSLSPNLATPNLYPRYKINLGGANSLRGFRYRDVGPKDNFGEPIGGRSLGRFTAEYTIPVIEKVRLALFYDVGFVSSGAFQFEIGRAHV